MSAGVSTGPLADSSPDLISAQPSTPAEVPLQRSVSDGPPPAEPAGSVVPLAPALPSRPLPVSRSLTRAPAPDRELPVVRPVVSRASAGASSESGSTVTPVAETDGEVSDNRGIDRRGSHR